MKRKKLLALLLTAAVAMFCLPVSAMAAKTVTLSCSEITLTKGYSVTLTASGADDISWFSDNTSVATVSAGGKVTAVGSGYCNIYAVSGDAQDFCEVKVVSGKLSVSQSELSLEAGQSAVVTVTAKGSHSISVSQSSKNVSQCSILKNGDGSSWTGNEVRLKITGIASGTSVIKVKMTKDAEVYKTVTVTVNGGTVSDNSNSSSSSLSSSGNASAEYYEVVSFSPEKKLRSDRIIYETEENITKYMLVPNNYDEAAVDYGFAKAWGNFEYYKIYSGSPIKKSDSDTVTSWTKTINGAAVTRYVLLPANYDETKLYSLRSSDTGVSEANYYTVSTAYPTAMTSTDSIYSFSSGSSIYYILLPQNYDTVKRDTAIAKCTGTYEYWTVYSSYPQTKSYNDTVRTWNKTSDNSNEARYVLLPEGYSESELSQFIGNNS